MNWRKAVHAEGKVVVCKGGGEDPSPFLMNDLFNAVKKNNKN